ncbi:hypothetical protein BDC45DRAFT_524907 [Circinella umbellata]|nr:hypothetical protein BDC45DRAFT_524907 [Circinella umbellata]
MMEDSEVRPCYDRGNGSPFCSPIPSDTWYNGSSYQFVWNYNYPFYVSSEYINLFLYYKENYAFQPIKNWTNMHRAEGQLAVQVDDSWFPNLLESESKQNKTWSIYGLYLPAGMDPSKELSNPESQYPRPFNFSVVQLAYPFNHPVSHPGEIDNGLPGWAMAVITLGALTTVAFAIAACLLARRHKNHRQKLLRTDKHTMIDNSLIQDTPSSPTALGGNPGTTMHQHHTKHQSVMTTAETGSSIYSTTPMIDRHNNNNINHNNQSNITIGEPRLSNQYYYYNSSRRSSSGILIPPPILPASDRVTSGLISRSSNSFDHDSTMTTSTSRRLADSTFMWMVDQSADHEQNDDEQRRRRLGEALLAQQLSEEEGASVKHAERRPITVQSILDQERHAVFEER